MVRWQLTWTTTSAVGKGGSIWYYRIAFWTTVVLSGANAIKRGGDTCFLYDGETAIFLEAIVWSSEGFQYRRGSFDGKARIGRLTDGWSWRRCMVWWPTLIFLTFCNVLAGF